MPLRELVARLGVGEPLTAPLAALTFDDGYRDNLEVAAPILRQFGVPAALFFAPGPQELGRPFWWDLMDAIGLTDEQLLERLKELPYGEFHEMVTEAIAELRPQRVSELVRRLYMTWDEVREWVGRGMVVGAHTLTHPILSRLTAEQARWEIWQSRAIIERQVGTAIDLFSYPNGRSEDYTPETTSILREVASGRRARRLRAGTTTRPTRCNCAGSARSTSRCRSSRSDSPPRPPRPSNDCGRCGAGREALGVSGCEVGASLKAALLAQATARQSMLSEDFSRCAPGNPLFERTIQRAFADGATTEGKCLTDMTWHRNWRMGRARYERIWLFPRRPPPPLRLLADALLAAGASDALPLRARIRAWRRGAHHPYQTAPAVVTTGAGR